MSQKQTSITQRSRPAKKAKIIVGLVVIVGAVVFWALRSSEPSYQGKGLNAWLRDFDKPFETTFLVSFQDMPEDALEAVRQLGTDSLPTLLTQIQAKDSPAVGKLYDLWDKQSVIKFRPTPAVVKQRRASIALAALGPKALPALPRLEKMLGNEHTLRPASLAIAYMGPEGVHVLTNALSSTNPVIRRECMEALSSVQSGGAVAIPVLIASLRDQDAMIQGRAALALAVIREEPSVAIPALTEMLTKTNSARHEAVMALGQYGLMATSAIPMLLECLVADDTMTRSSTRTALRRIGAETNAIIAVLTNALTNSEINLRRFAINTLAGYGQAASNAVPALILCLNDPVFVIHNAASNALANIDAEFLGRLSPTNPVPLR